MESAPLPETWLPSSSGLSGSFFDAAEHLRLVGLGLVPRDADTEVAERYFATPEPERAADTARRRSAEAPASGQSPDQRGGSMAATADEKRRARAKKSGLSGMSKAKLRAYLLEHITVADSVWNAAYGAPEREKGESREAYIKRVLRATAR